jgi:uncharacterized protein
MAPVVTNTPNVGPVSGADRIQFIDVLRGAALFGILAANMRAFDGPIDAYGNINVLFPARVDVIAQGVVNLFFQGKFISIFSFLFGLGFAMQLSRAQARGVSFFKFYPRRLAALALFGIVHGALIWSGDILLTYSLAGALLLLFRNCRQKTLLYWIAGIFSLPIVVSSFFLGLYYSPWRPAWMKDKPPDMAKLHHVVDIYARGSLPKIMWQNLVEWSHQLPTELFAIYAAAIFLCGMWVWRAGIVQNLAQYKTVLQRLCAWCLPIGLAINAYFAYAMAVSPPGHFSLSVWFAQVLWLPGSHTLAAGYMCALALLFLQPAWQRVLSPFAAVGRMALTNYLMQSVLCTSFFYHYGTGWFGSVGPALGFVPVIVLYAAQLVFSNIWLRHYRFGPMEWLWRGLTYGVFPVMRRSAFAGAEPFPQAL